MGFISGRLDGIISHREGISQSASDQSILLNKKESSLLFQ